MTRVGDIVHLLQGGRCHAAIVLSYDEDAALLHCFGELPNNWHPYNSLTSARPTSGWHWPDEHDPDVEAGYG